MHRNKKTLLIRVLVQARLPFLSFSSTSLGSFKNASKLLLQRQVKKVHGHGNKYRFELVSIVLVMEISQFKNFEFELLHTDPWQWTIANGLLTFFL